MSPDIETRTTTSPVECRGAQGKPKTIRGYAAVFNSRSKPLGPQGFTETVAPSFFNKHRGGNGFADVIARYDHRSDFLLGSVAAGNLGLEIRSAACGIRST